MSLGEIIRNKREELGLTLDEVGSKVGFSKPYLSTIETGKVKNPPSDELLRKLEQVLGFETGMLLQIAHMEGIPADIKEKYEAAEAEIEKWRRLAKDLKEHKGEIERLDSFLEDRQLNTQRSNQTYSPGRLVPIINKVTAGYPADFNDLDYPAGVADEYIRCPDIHDPTAFAVRVVGDSMEPKFREGDIVIFSPAAEVRNGDDCFVRFAMPHETTFKRVFFEAKEMIRLQPRNDKYAPMVVEGKSINGLYRAIIRYEKL